MTFDIQHHRKTFYLVTYHTITAVVKESFTEIWWLTLHRMCMVYCLILFVVVCFMFRNRKDSNRDSKCLLFACISAEAVCMLSRSRLPVYICMLSRSRLPVYICILSRSRLPVYICKSTLKLSSNTVQFDCIALICLTCINGDPVSVSVSVSAQLTPALLWL